jgi:hypothetical protein
VLFRPEDPLRRLASNPFAGNILGMPVTLSSSVLQGIDAVPVAVLVNREEPGIVEPKSDRCLLSVRRPEPGEEGSGISPLRKRAPARLIA